MKKLLLILFALAACSVSALAQPRTVTGTVLSGEDGAPLIQAAVIVKGTQIGVATDLDGRYSIRVPNNDAVLIFSYAGMESTEVKVGNQSVINVTLQPELVDVDEVMVVAFGKTKKSAFTGSATEVTSKELEKKQVSNVVNALQGKVPGVTLSSDDNQPGKSPTVNVRGRNSFSSDGGPLYVVDGVPYSGNIAMINPQDVESTVLLKDAASAALYGSRGANGVILITTKSGKASKSGDCVGTNVSATARVGGNFRGVPNYDLITDPREYMSMAYLSLLNYTQTTSPTNNLDQNRTLTLRKLLVNGKNTFNYGYFPFTVEGAMDPTTATWDQWFTYDSGTGLYSLSPNATTGRLVDAGNFGKHWIQPENWEKAMYKPGLRQEYTVSVSGRGEKLSHYFSMGYLDESAYIKGSSFKRYTARLRADYRPKKWLNMGANINYTYAFYKRQLSATYYYKNPLLALAYMAPIYPIYVRDENGEVMHDAMGNPLGDYGVGRYTGLLRRGLNNSNPIADLAVNKTGTTRNVVNARAYTDIILPYGFKVSVNAAYDFAFVDWYSMGSLLQGEAAPYGGGVDREMFHYGTFNTQQLLSWSHDFGKHHLDALLGHEFFYDFTQELEGYKKKMFDPYRIQLNAAYGEPLALSYYVAKAVEGYLMRLNYDYAERYFLSASYRRDGSSNFAKSKRWGNFFSLGLSWLISRESFMESTSSWLNMLKLKASYGLQGNDKVEGSYYDVYEISNFLSGFSTIYTETGNPFLTWETSHAVNIGIESSFLRNRLNVSIDVFYKLISDMVFRRPLAPSSGKSYIYQNIGDMQNVGVEFQVSGVLYQDKNVRWSASINGAHISNKLLKLPDEFTKNEYKGLVDGRKFYKIGSPYNNLLLVHFVGLDEQGQSLFQVKDKDGKVKTTTHFNEAVSDFYSKKYYTNIDPMIFGGFSTNVEFFGFDFSLGCSYQIGGHAIDYNYRRYMTADMGSPMHVDLRNSWRPQNTNTNVPQLAYGNPDMAPVSDRFLTSKSYFSIDNITLGYTLPQKWLSAIKLNSLRVYFVCDNVWLFSARKGFDPTLGHLMGLGRIRSVSGGVTLNF